VQAEWGLVVFNFYVKGESKMDTKNAMRIRKVLPKKYVNIVELLMIEFLEVAVNFKKGLINEGEAQSKMSEILKKGITKRIISPSNMKEFMDLVDDCEEMFEFLKNKHK
jgi:hypothetical protein